MSFDSDSAPAVAWDIEDLLAAADARRDRNRRIRVVAAAAVVAAVVYVAATMLVGRETDDAARALDAGPQSATGEPLRTVKLEGDRVAPYGLPTLTQFAASGFVARIVVGRVTAGQPYVTSDGEVRTLMTIRTEDPRGVQPPETITVGEYGGVVRRGDAWGDIAAVEAHNGPIPDSELNELVDYTDGTQHPVVGDTELIFLRAVPAGDDADYYAAARMTLNPSSGRFEWAGEAPNHKWADGLTIEDAATTFATLLRGS